MQLGDAFLGGLVEGVHCRQQAHGIAGRRGGVAIGRQTLVTEGREKIGRRRGARVHGGLAKALEVMQ